MRKKQETTVETNHSISKLLAQKRNLENSFERKQRIWETTLKEHAELETIDAKLVSLGYYTGLNK